MLLLRAAISPLHEPDNLCLWADVSREEVRRAMAAMIVKRPKAKRRQPRNFQPHGPVPKGKAWCSRCKDFVEVDKFGFNHSRDNGEERGRQHWCKKCVSEYWTIRRNGMPPGELSEIDEAEA